MVTRETHTQRERETERRHPFTRTHAENYAENNAIVVYIHTLMALDGVPTGGADGAQHIAKYFMDTLGPNCFEFLWDEGK